MTATRKLSIAAVLLVAGFGVARLMGEPANRWYAPQHGESTVARTYAKPAPRPATNHPAAPGNGARLVPDFGADNPYQLRTDTKITNSPALQSPSTDVATTSASPVTVSNSAGLQSPSNYPLRPKLRNEAPRPVSVTPRDTDLASVPRLIDPYATDAAKTPIAPAAEPPALSPSWPANPVVNAGFVQAPPAAPVPQNVAAIQATYNEPTNANYAPLSAAPAASPPPWPEADDEAEETGPRTHIVRDNDSLEKLASRYLGDPSRADEIFVANRDLLTSPDLLPIGAKLVIPNRGPRRAADGWPQESAARNTPIRSATQSNLVPVRPIPSSANIAPRAVLMAPIHAD